jgi:hypothetical protein
VVRSLVRFAGSIASRRQWSGVRWNEVDAAWQYRGGVAHGGGVRHGELS